MKVLVVGANGNMGRRYCSILDHLEVDYDTHEINQPSSKVKYNYILVATPTTDHLHTLDELSKYQNNAKILCEKPISKTTSIYTKRKLDHILELFSDNLFMVNQYAYYSENIEIPKESVTLYDFYNSGKDGISWDCIQLIHLAKGAIVLKNESPIWKCKINGVSLDREQIDLCYIKMIKDFLNDGKEYGRLWGLDDIRVSHKKARAHERLFNRDSSPIDVNEIT